MLRHRRLGVLVALFLSIWTAVAAAAPYAYVTNSSTGNISVIDTRTNVEVDLIALPAGSVPWGVAIHPEGKWLYVTHFGNGILYVVDLETKAVQGYSTGSLPFGVAVHPAGSRVYVTRAVLMGNNMAIFDTAGYTRTDVSGGLLPAGVAVNAATGHLYVANLSGVRVFNLADNSLVANVALGTRGFGVAVHPRGHRFYVALPGTNELALIDSNTFSFSKVGVGLTPQGVAVSPDGTRVYVGNYGGRSVTALDENGGFIHTVPVGTNPYGVQVSPDSARVFVANWGSNNVSAIDAVSFAVTSVALRGTAPVGFGISMLPIRALVVGVDIMPGGNPNMINLRAQGTLPVAILGSAEFNVATVDPATVTLAGAGVVMRKNGPMASMDDVNGDGSVDLVVHVARKDLKLQAGDTEAVLEGKTYDGLAIRGTDSVVVIH